MSDLHWIDCSVPIHPDTVRWPGDPAVGIEPVKALARGDSCNLCYLSMGTHAGTHVDAPKHFLVDGAGVDQMPIDAMMGPARVLAIRDSRVVTVGELEAAGIGPGERILLKTRNSERPWWMEPFTPEFVHLATDAARWLADRRTRLVGVDYLSVSGYQKNATDVHQALLGAGVWIVEGLNLSAVSPGRYELLCLPLRIADGDGAPARVLLRPMPAAGR